MHIQDQLPMTTQSVIFISMFSIVKAIRVFRTNVSWMTKQIIKYMQISSCSVVGCCWRKFYLLQWSAPVEMQIRRGRDWVVSLRLLNHFCLLMQRPAEAETLRLQELYCFRLGLPPKVSPRQIPGVDKFCHSTPLPEAIVPVQLHNTIGALLPLCRPLHSLTYYTASHIKPSWNYEDLMSNFH